MSKNPEVFFYGQIEGCSNITEGADGIFVEAFWNMVQNGLQ